MPTNKYAEGYPGKRYYGGCEVIDEIETLAIERAKELFGAEHANVQPHAGAQTNMAVYSAVLEPGDTVLGLRLDHGGHLTHGLKVNFSGRLYAFEHYGVSRETNVVDYDEVLAIAKEHRPRMIVCGGSAYPRTVEADKFREIADEVDAMLLCDMAHFAGLVAAGLHPNPVPYCDFVSSTTHKTLSGPRSGFVLCREEHAKALDRAVFPGMQGGPMEHVIAAKATCFRIAAVRRVPRVPDAGARERRRARRRAPGRRARRPHRRHRHAPAPDRPPRLGVDGQGRRGAPCRGEHHGEPEHRPVRRAAADRRLGPAGGTPACTMRGFDEDDFREVGRIITGALSDDAGHRRPGRALARAVREAAALPGLPRLDDVRGMT